MKRNANENLDILVEILATKQVHLFDLNPEKVEHLKNYLIPRGERMTTQTEPYIEKQIAALKTDVERRDKIIFGLCKVLSDLYAKQHKEDQ